MEDFFNEMFLALPEYQEKYKKHMKKGRKAVREVIMSKTSPFAFVEFWTEELASTGLEFNYCNFMGKPLRTSRPTDFSSIVPLPPAMDLSPLCEAGLLPSTSRRISSLPNKTARELFFGGLVRLSDADMREFIEPACVLLPEYNAKLGSAVVNINMHPSEKFCFVEFQSQELADIALEVFNGMQLLDTTLKVCRPTNWADQQDAASQVQQGDSVTGAMAAGALAVSGLGL